VLVPSTCSPSARTSGTSSWAWSASFSVRVDAMRSRTPKCLRPCGPPPSVLLIASESHRATSSLIKRSSTLPAPIVSAPSPPYRRRPGSSELNAYGVLAYRRAAAALRQIPAVGVSNPIASHLLETARVALEDVLAFNRRIAREIPVDRFFRNIRPYFKPYRVGSSVHRGANAGDFSAINEIDVLLGLCDLNDPFYESIVTEKSPFVPPEDQPALRELGATGTLLARFEAEAEAGVTPQLRRNAELFLAVCQAHGAAYAFHHHALVKPFLERPAAAIPPDRFAVLSASGPPLEEVIAHLGRLSILRSARAPLERLRGLIA
jgi:hypothetical protein